jgi:hypothetical protein
VELARYFADRTTARPDQSSWSRRIIWGNQLVRGNLRDDGDQWANTVVWGSETRTPSGDDTRNVVWGRRCGGNDCQERWTIQAAHDESVVWGTNVDDSVVWGTSAGDQSVVWGTAAVLTSAGRR